MDAVERWQHALDRYGDALYRLAFLRDPHARRAARAVAAAFLRIDWSTLPQDDRLEARLIAALPPVPHHSLRFPQVRGRRTANVLPPAFRRLAPRLRLLLALRLVHNDDAAAIASILGRPVEQVRIDLYDAIATIAGETTTDAACRACRILHMTDRHAPNPHLQTCALCEAAIARLGEAEASLRAALVRATHSMMLPRDEREALRERLRHVAASPTVRPQRRIGALLGVVAVVVVILAVMIGLPRSQPAQNVSQTATPQQLVARALEQYATVPSTAGIIHEQYEFTYGDPPQQYQADTWTDAAHPARHRMQLMDGEAVREWQSGDGNRSIQYFTDRDGEMCGRDLPDARPGLAHINRWPVAADMQETMRSARWHTGPWALGLRYLEQADGATLRSLGRTQRGAESYVTVSEDDAAGGSVLLSFDTASGRLRDVQVVHIADGRAEQQTVWRHTNTETLEGTAAQHTAVFGDYPASNKPTELARTVPILDAACPIVGSEQAWSLPYAITTIGNAVYALPTLPDGVEQVYVAGPPHPGIESVGTSFPTNNLSMVYVGDGKRLMLSQLTMGETNRDGTPRPDAIEVGDWSVLLATRSPRVITGDARLITSADVTDNNVITSFTAVRVYAEGWTEDQVLAMLGTMRALQIADWWHDHAHLYEPKPLDTKVLDALMPATLALELKPNTTQRLVMEQRSRPSPAFAALRDPYHMRTFDTYMDLTTRLDADGASAQYRNDVRELNGSNRVMNWNDGQDGWSFDPATNVALRYPGLGSARDYTGARTQLSEPLRTFFRYPEMRVVAHDGLLVTLQVTVPVTTTDYYVSPGSRMEQEYYYGQPWLRDLQTDTISFRIEVDTARQRLREWTVEANGPDGTAMIKQLTIHDYETLPDVSPQQPQFQPPPTARFTTVDGWAGLTPESLRTVVALSEAVTLAPTPLWGWPDDSFHFVNASVAKADSATSMGFSGLEEAIYNGSAMRLHFEGFPDVTWSLVEAQRDRMLTLLQSSVPVWNRSQAYRVEIGGVDRSCWFMYNDNDLHSIYCDLDQTILVVEHDVPLPTGEIVAALSRLQPLQ